MGYVKECIFGNNLVCHTRPKYKHDLKVLVAFEFLFFVSIRNNSFDNTAAVIGTTRNSRTPSINKMMAVLRIKGRSGGIVIIEIIVLLSS